MTKSVEKQFITSYKIGLKILIFQIYQRLETVQSSRRISHMISQDAIRLVERGIFAVKKTKPLLCWCLANQSG